MALRCLNPINWISQNEESAGQSYFSLAQGSNFDYSPLVAFCCSSSQL